MKCKYCIYFIDKDNKCEFGTCKDNCRNFKQIGRCIYNCEECRDRYECDRASEVQDYIKDLTRYSEV